MGFGYFLLDILSEDKYQTHITNICTSVLIKPEVCVQILMK